MFKKTKFKKLLADYDCLDLSSITTWGRYAEDLERGKEGEKVVFDILSKYTDKIHQSIVIWAWNKRFTTEIDFIAEINGYLVLVEVKQWFGKLERNTEKNVALLSYTNINGKDVIRERNDPIYTIGSFTRDFIDYLKPNKPKKHSQIKRFVVFTRNELEIGETYRNLESSIILCHLSEFEKHLQKLSNMSNPEPYLLTKQLPTWDYYFDEKNRQWHKCVVTSLELNTNKGIIKISDIDSMLISNRINGKSLVLLRNGAFIKCKVNRREILLSGKPKYAIRYIYRFIKFNNSLRN